MQISHILSDLTSLRACDHASALALVSAYKTLQGPSGVSTSTQTKSDRPNTSSSSTPESQSQDPELHKAEENLDLQRAFDLMELHYGVKVRHVEHGEAELEQAREGVRKVVEEFREKGKGV